MSRIILTIALSFLLYSSMNKAELRDFLNHKYEAYAQPAFIVDDPIQIPHQYSEKKDVEIAGLFAALFAWGQRKTIINKANELMARMDNAPADYVLNHSAADLKSLDGFVHRTFNEVDVKGFVKGLKTMYAEHDSLEYFFIHSADTSDLKNGLHQFKQSFVSRGIEQRTYRHLPDPFKGSAAKRVNMYLRWMVRNDAVDFGIWQNISPALLSCPLDVHSGRVARSLNLLARTQNDWRAVEELNAALIELDPQDPVKYDFALFGLGVFEGFQ